MPRAVHLISKFSGDQSWFLRPRPITALFARHSGTDSYIASIFILRSINLYFYRIDKRSSAALFPMVTFVFEAGPRRHSKDSPVPPMY
jgi:hypothetical protein